MQVGPVLQHEREPAPHRDHGPTQHADRQLRGHVLVLINYEYMPNIPTSTRICSHYVAIVCLSLMFVALCSLQYHRCSVTKYS